ncbi:MAG: preprotein translocase subunit SecA [Anaerolineae bacterium]
MLKGVLTKIAGDPNEKELNRLWPIVEEINELESSFEVLSDQKLQDKTTEFVGRLHAGESLDDLLPEAFAAVREASKRTTGMRHFDVQLLGGIVLHQGKVAEMKTGEGKTLVATLALYLNALTGKGAHLVTVNDYLAKRDTQWMGPIYHLLGLSVGVIQSTTDDGRPLPAFIYDPDYQSSDDRYQYLRPAEHRREAYLADITYGTNNEFGFDYLRDNMVYDLSQHVQRDLHYAIVDEVDNILIDEARTPLIISGPAEESDENYRRLARMVPRLRGDVDYTVDEKSRVVTMTDEGISKIEGWLGVENLYDPKYYELTHFLDQALRAQVLFKRDKDYIVKDGQVIIVDEFTGRLMYGRRYSEGLHQAIEAKEGVQVQRESLTLATITFQNYFRMYEKLAGMTGTAATEAEEFHKIYNLDVIIIPTHMPMIRIDHPDLVYKNQESKFRAVVGEIEELHRQGRPVLVGTIAIETSEMLSEMLRRQGIPHQVLNAKHHEKEAAIIAQAGRPGAVTIATNMAGRGVDILLGGNPEGLAREELRKRGRDLTNISPDEWEEVLAHFQQLCEADKKKVLELGGLHVLGTERHEARRIDNQLRGRSGRQGDPGSSRFYVSLEDDLMRRFGGERVKGFMEWAGVDEDIPIEHNLVSKSIENAQVKVEGYNFDIRKHVLEYDDVVNKQREVIYDQRRRVLSESDLRPIIMRMVEDEIRGLVDFYTAGGDLREEWDLAALHTAARSMLPSAPTLPPSHWGEMDFEEIEEELLQWAETLYAEQTQEMGLAFLRQAEMEGASLATLAENDHPAYRLAYQAARCLFEEEEWDTIKNTRLRMLDKEQQAKVKEAFRQGVTLFRDRAVMLEIVDRHWIHHLTALDELRDGIGLRAYGQQDPLVSYKKESHQMFDELTANIQHDIAHTVFNRVLTVMPQAAPTPARQMRFHHGGDGERRPVRRVVSEKIGRNAPCPCGSGKKYKHCCLRKERVSFQAQSGKSKRGRKKKKRAAKGKKRRK